MHNYKLLNILWKTNSNGKSFEIEKQVFPPIGMRRASTLTAYLRPIVTLKADLEVTGSETSSDHYKFVN